MDDALIHESSQGGGDCASPGRRPWSGRRPCHFADLSVLDPGRQRLMDDTGYRAGSSHHPSRWTYPLNQIV